MIEFVSDKRAKMWTKLLLIIVCSWNVARYAVGRCPEFHKPVLKIGGVFGKTVIFPCNLGKKCYEGMWQNNNLGKRMHALDCNEDHCVATNDSESKNTLYLYNLTYDQVSSYDCVCKEPQRILYVCYDLTAVCQLEMTVGNMKTIYNGSYLSNVQRTYLVDINEGNSFNIKCQRGANRASNCTDHGSVASMPLNGCAYTCSLPVAPNVDPCIVQVILQVNDTGINFTFWHVTDKPITSTSKPTRWPPSLIRAITPDHPFTSEVSTSLPESDKTRLIDPWLPPDTALHTTVIYILIYCCSVGVMLLLIATSMVRIYHIYYKGEGKYKADVYRPGSIYGQPAPNKDYEKYADVVSDKNDYKTSSCLLSKDCALASSGDAV
ncbi:hypothetical protein HOLleu_24785 [Holothuria leucospilota]|uniref:Uncharacterized protein n=1 Tax=Holothuria leucospilota TaxID=206669 RepID=A0A9Q1BRR0_HOLLE|nr:hypothetical protein HOLleu_24785 [Holothuria leucospilota]